MKVKDVMTTDVRTCTPETTVAAAANLMWDGDCGILPVMDNGKLIGVVTDRDMYIALATRDVRASAMNVGAVSTSHVVSCTADDDIETALALMKDARVRRLPVVGFGESLVGIVSMNDIVLAAGHNKTVKPADMIATLQSICGHHHPQPHVIAA